MLISEEYRALNSALHATGRFGHGGHRHAQAVAALRERFSCATVLDYGCGQGTLGAALGSPEWWREYDPAIAGKDGEPPRCDLVICTDVLEHIEPDCLDDVLDHLCRLAKKAVYCVIATRPAAKVLADGRNAHLIVRDAVWWQERLETRFRVADWGIRDGEVTFVLERQIEIPVLHTKSAVSKDIRGEQMRLNIPRVSGRLHVLPPNGRTAVLCCYGPSLRQTWKQAASAREMGAYVATVSGAHDFMIERGVVPDVHMECDPREHKARHTQRPHPDVKYLIASCVHPKLIDQLKDSDLYLWHVATDQGAMDTLSEIEPGAIAIAGGGSIGLRALNVLYALGFRHFLVLGMDCSHAEGEQHAGVHFGKKKSQSRIRCGDRWFTSSLTDVAYARQFFDNIRQMNEQATRDGEKPFNNSGDRVRIDLAGDGLLQAMAGMKQ